MLRRSFLRTAALAGAAIPITGARSVLHAHAERLGASPFARATSTPDDRVLVIIRLDGGNDGLNMLVPYHDEEYYRARRRGLTNDISVLPEDTIALPTSSTLGLHPALAPMLPLFDEEKVTVVQNVGYENTVMSHFRSREIWLSASDGEEFVGTGWIARTFEQEHPEFPAELGDAPYALEIGPRLSTALRGPHGDAGMAYNGPSYIADEPSTGRSAAARARAERQYLETVLRQSSRYSRAIAVALERMPRNAVAYPSVLEHIDGARHASQFAEVARMIAGGLRTKVYVVPLPFYDFHVRQVPRERIQHDLFAQLLVTFRRDLEALGCAGRVTILTISEFGRRVYADGSGTDHGGAAPLLVVGDAVIAGFIGNDPDLHDLVGPGNLRVQYDYRQIYASVLSQWLGASSPTLASALLGRQFDQLPIFRRPRVTPPAEPAPAAHDEPLGPPTPQPAATSVTFRLDAVSSPSATLRIVARDGRIVHERAVARDATELTLDVAGLPPGVYVAELADGNRRGSRAFVVAR